MFRFLTIVTAGFAFLAALATKAHAQDAGPTHMDVLVSCVDSENNYEGRDETEAENINDFLQWLRRDLSEDVEIVSRHRIKGQVTMVGPGDVYEQDRFVVMRIPLDAIEAYMEREIALSESDPSYEYRLGDPPRDAVEVLWVLQMGAIGTCDFLVPTRWTLFRHAEAPSGDATDVSQRRGEPSRPAPAEPSAPEPVSGAQTAGE